MLTYHVYMRVFSNLIVQAQATSMRVCSCLKMAPWAVWVPCVSPMMRQDAARGRIRRRMKSPGPSSSPQRPVSPSSHSSFLSRSYTAYTLFIFCCSPYSLPAAITRHADPHARPKATQEIKIWMSRVQTPTCQGTYAAWRHPHTFVRQSACSLLSFSAMKHGPRAPIVRLRPRSACIGLRPRARLGHPLFQQRAA